MGSLLRETRSIVMLSGSNKTVPGFDPPTSTRPRNARRSRPEISTNPPFWKPRAVAVPENSVVSSDQTTISPPSFPNPSAKKELRGSTNANCAVGKDPSPRKFPPKKMRPPFSVPEASNLADIAATRSPNTPISPDPLFSETSIAPETIAVPGSGFTRTADPAKLTVPSGLTVKRLTRSTPPPVSSSGKLNGSNPAVGIEVGAISKLSRFPGTLNRNSSRPETAVTITVPPGDDSEPVFAVAPPSNAKLRPGSTARSPSLTIDPGCDNKNENVAGSPVKFVIFEV
ncbi:hypothetical protein CKA32_005484 [Geitlerinema sp. FC II]|nr:hypothetical protein CKA32_005484 [Geitlerinema sp. FC II]